MKKLGKGGKSKACFPLNGEHVEVRGVSCHGAWSTEREIGENLGFKWAAREKFEPDQVVHFWFG